MGRDYALFQRTDSLTVISKSNVASPSVTFKTNNGNRKKELDS